MKDISSNNPQMNIAASDRVTPINEKELIQEQACHWISRIDRGLKDSEKAELLQWTENNENHKSALFEMAALWDDLSVMHELSGLFPLSEKDNNVKGHSHKPAYFAIAASIAVFCALLLAVFQTPQQTLPELNPQRTIVFQTGVGEQKTLTLEDGSLLSLNTSSTVEVNFSEERRDIRITAGEAHFEVTSDAVRPFVVSAGNNKVTAIGTAFNVQLLENQRFELLVTEGKVLVSEINQQMPQNISQLKSPEFEALGTIMLSGDTGVFNGHQSEALNTLSLDQVQRNLSWQQGMLVFQGETLKEALDEMSRYTDNQFQISDESLNSLRVAGYFKVGDSDGLLHALKHNFQIEHHKQDNVIHLSASGAP